MAPRNPAQFGPGGRGFFGTVTVGTRGQISIPAQARKSLGLEPGDQLVVLTDPAQGLALVPLPRPPPGLEQQQAPQPPLRKPQDTPSHAQVPTGIAKTTPSGTPLDHSER